MLYKGKDHVWLKGITVSGGNCTREYTFDLKVVIADLDESDIMEYAARSMNIRFQNVRTKKDCNALLSVWQKAGSHEWRAPKPGTKMVSNIESMSTAEIAAILKARGMTADEIKKLFAVEEPKSEPEAEPEEPEAEAEEAEAEEQDEKDE